MRFRTLEIRWHDSKPISSCDFQPVPFKKARPASSADEREKWAAQAYRLATAGEDNHVRVWMVYPNIRAVMPGDRREELEKEKPRPARVEYLATLSRHSAAVNVVRFSPNGELIASAGDDGMVIIWAPSSTPPSSHTAYGSDLSPADLQLEKEWWKPRTTFRCTTMQVYDLAWSPTGEFLVAGSTDNVGRVFASVDGRPLLELAEHTHFVQGVAWDPLNEYIATQSSDRAMHVYRISDKGTFEAHAIGRNTRFPAPSHSSHSHTHAHRAPSRGRAHSRTPSVHRDDLAALNLPASTAAHPALPSINTSMNMSTVGGPTPLNTPATAAEWRRPQVQRGRSASMESDRTRDGGEWEMPGTPASVAAGSASSVIAGVGGAGSSSMFPPPAGAGAGAGAGPSSRRSSFSGSNAPSSPGFSAVSGFSRFGRSPSPMPALPAIRTPPSGGTGAGWAERTRSRERAASASASAAARYPPANAPDAYDERRHPDAGTRLYGDESFSNFFRRLAFSPDGALLLTPAGTFEDPSASVVGWEGLGAGAATTAAGAGAGGDAGAGGAGSVTPDTSDAPARGRKARPVVSTSAAASASTSASASASSSATPAPAPGAGGAAAEPGSASSVYIYSRANFARPPVAQLPGHKKASVAVRFSPVLFELRAGVQGGGSQQAGGGEPRMGTGTGTATGEEGDWERSRDAEESVEVDLVGPLASSSSSSAGVGALGAGGGSTIAAPAPQQHASFNVLASPALSPADVRRPPTPAASKPSTPAPGHASASSVPPGSTPALTGSVFALPYRMLYAVVTMDTVAIYDTQQAGPVCLLTKLHYDEFTDLTWSPDGQCLMLSSRDGYCTLVTFDEILPTHHTQQAALQLQQIAAQHSVPISYAASSAHGHSGSGSGSQAGGSRKRPLEPLTPAASVDGDRDVVMPPTPMPTPGGSGSGSGSGAGAGAGMTASTSGTSISSLDTEATGTGVDGEADGPPKKKRRVALTRVGDL
ncbi:chromatin assembly complex protein [Mycena alexandri]|uniref:Chromatin assembly complex protein n=1 Tax=Mycena alexandri TaxID=1745969 RepID=A0AAD6WQC2_9AGAR|nr:chromatin assembly complex protein [Mycena alexandri]